MPTDPTSEPDLYYEEHSDVFFGACDLVVPDLADFYPEFPKTEQLISTIRTSLVLPSWELDEQTETPISKIHVDVTAICSLVPTIDLPLLPEHLPAGEVRDLAQWIADALRGGLLFVLAGSCLYSLFLAVGRDLT